MKRPVLLDLFCGGGGAAMGYYEAGFDVIGVDLHPQPYYPFPFIQADALDVLHSIKGVDYIHASPPCQAYSWATPMRTKTDHANLIGPTRKALMGVGLPWIIESVPGAPLREETQLCGAQFGLHIRRHRRFESSLYLPQHPVKCEHIWGRLLPGEHAFDHNDERVYADAMGCHWMGRDWARQAIPPAYTKWLGTVLLNYDDWKPDARKRGRPRTRCQPKQTPVFA